MHGSRSKIPSKNLVHIYIYDVKFLALLGAPYIYIHIHDISRLRNKRKITGGIEVTGRRGKRRRKLLDDLKERRGDSHLKEEALDRTVWRAGFGRGFGPVVRQTAKWINE
jgi:hypothetical protein